MGKSFISYVANITLYILYCCVFHTFVSFILGAWFFCYHVIFLEYFILLTDRCICQRWSKQNISVLSCCVSLNKKKHILLYKPWIWTSLRDLHKQDQWSNFLPFPWVNKAFGDIWPCGQWFRLNIQRSCVQTPGWLCGMSFSKTLNFNLPPFE